MAPVKNEAMIAHPSGRRPRRKGSNHLPLPSVVIALPIAIVCSGIIKGLFPTLPTEYLGILAFNAAFASSDLLDGIRGKRDILSPRALISAIMLNNVYIAPLLHLTLESYPRYVSLPENMEVAFQNLALIHFFGLLVYFAILRLSPQDKQLTNIFDKVDDPKYVRYISSSLIILGWVSFAFYIYQVLALGGPSAWLQAQLNYRESTLGPGWMIALGEAFPTLFFMAYLVKLKDSDLQDSQIRRKLVLAVILLAITVFVSSGLRGSRANVVWPILTALLLIHILHTQIRPKILVAISIVLLSFSGIYDIYKKTGTEGFQEFQVSGVAVVEETAGREFGLVPMLIGDFSRSSMQAIILDRWNTDGFILQYGTTYVGDILEFIPGTDGSEAYPSKRAAATEILYGEGSSTTRSTLDSRIYGLQGEALMNFGPPFSVLVMGLFALVITRTERSFAHAKLAQSVRLAILSAVVTPAVLLLYLSDLDNVIYNLTSNALLPVIALSYGHVLYSLRENKKFKKRKRSF